VVEVESDIEQDNSIEDSECPEQQDVSATPNVPMLIRPTWKSQRQAAKVLMTVNSIVTRRIKGVKTKKYKMRQSFSSFFIYLDQDL